MRGSWDNGPPVHGEPSQAIYPKTPPWRNGATRASGGLERELLADGAATGQAKSARLQVAASLRVIHKARQVAHDPLLQKIGAFNGQKSVSAVWRQVMVHAVAKTHAREAQGDVGQHIGAVGDGAEQQRELFGLRPNQPAQRLAFGVRGVGQAAIELAAAIGGMKQARRDHGGRFSELAKKVARAGQMIQKGHPAVFDPSGSPVAQPLDLFRQRRRRRLRKALNVLINDKGAHGETLKKNQKGARVLNTKQRRSSWQLRSMPVAACWVFEGMVIRRLGRGK